jgi:hypothetical protein
VNRAAIQGLERRTTKQNAQILEQNARTEERLRRLETGPTPSTTP